MTSATDDQNNSNLDNSRPIDFNWLIQDQEVNAVTDALITVIKDVGNRERVTSSLNDAVQRIWASLMVSYLSSKRKWLAISLDKNFYSTPTDRYNLINLSYLSVKIVIESLTQAGYIESAVGFKDRASGIGRRTRIRATEQLFDLAVGHGTNIKSFRYDASAETIILKHPKSSKINDFKDYKDTEFTIEARNNLTEINQYISEHWIDLYLSNDHFDKLEDRLNQQNNQGDRKDLALFRTRLVRIFNNGSFEQGGRFYHGWWMEIPSEYRERITINGKRCYEVDYSGMHFAMMYAEVKKPCPADPYAHSSFDRNLVKKAANIMINAVSFEACYRAVEATIKELGLEEDARALVGVILEMHDEIGKYFMSGHGIKLQNMDSAIAEKVILRMKQDYNVLALPVHDSFICRARYANTLSDVMNEVFHEVTGIEPKMKLSDISNSFDTGIDSEAQGEIINLSRLSLSELEKDISEYSAYHSREP